MFTGRGLNTGVILLLTPVFIGRVPPREHGRHFGHPRSRAVDTARERGPWTRIVCTELKLENVLMLRLESCILFKPNMKCYLVCNWGPSNNRDRKDFRKYTVRHDEFRDFSFSFWKCYTTQNKMFSVRY